MKRYTLGSLPFKGPGYLFVSFNHQAVASLLQWRHTRWLKETPSPLSKDPLHSFQVKLNYPPCLFEDVQCAHKFGSSNWPLAHFSACRECCLCSSPQTEGIHKALEACPWHGVTYNLPKYFSRFHVIFPWFLLFFAKFHDFSRCTLIFPVNVGTLSFFLAHNLCSLLQPIYLAWLEKICISCNTESQTFNCARPLKDPGLFPFSCSFWENLGKQESLSVGGRPPACQ